MSVKQSTSGMQFVEWYELRKLYGDGYWKEFAKQRPRGFDSRAQIFDRLAKGDDKICALGRVRRLPAAKGQGRADRVRGAARRAAGRAAAATASSTRRRIPKPRGCSSTG